MDLSSKSKLLLLGASILLLGACSDYMNNWDTVSFRAGDAVDANSEIHEKYPWHPNHERRSGLD